MLDSTLDLISQAVSNNLYVFCIFNLIIVMILMGSKHGSNMGQDYEIPVSTHTYHKQDTDVKQLVNKSEQAMNMGGVSAAHDQETATEDNRGDENDCNGDNTVATDEDDEGDDELRRRIEEFIAKVNREWRAEKLGMSDSA